MRPLARFFDRALSVATLAALGLAGGLIGGAVLAYSAVQGDVAARTAMLDSLRSACLSGNGNACELYIAEIKR